MISFRFEAEPFGLSGGAADAGRFARPAESRGRPSGGAVIPLAGRTGLRQTPGRKARRGGLGRRRRGHQGDAAAGRLAIPHQCPGPSTAGADRRSRPRGQDPTGRYRGPAPGPVRASGPAPPARRGRRGRGSSGSGGDVGLVPEGGVLQLDHPALEHLPGEHLTEFPRFGHGLTSARERRAPKTAQGGAAGRARATCRRAGFARPRPRRGSLESWSDQRFCRMTAGGVLPVKTKTAGAGAARISSGRNRVVLCDPGSARRDTHEWRPAPRDPRATRTTPAVRR